jgi:hypothetical protein
MFRNILAVTAGYVTMAVIVILVTIPLALAFGQPLDPEAAKTVPNAAYFLLNLVLSFFAAVAGGWVTARIGSRPMAWALSGMVLLFGALYAYQSPPHVSPGWYLIVLPIIGAIGAMAGGRLRAMKSNR